MLYVPNRCILCTRCVRFMDDVAHDPVLNVSERGDRAFIGKFEGKDLTHPWAGNVVDLCPVGALLSKDFLNKARAWELDRTASVCPDCSQGCNMIVETRDNVVVRLAPAAERGGQPVLHVRPRSPELSLDEPPAIASTCRWCVGDGALDGADWEVAHRRRGARARGQARRSCSRRRTCRTKRCSCSRGSWRSTGGAGAFRVEQGDEAPLPGVEDLALRADRAANVQRRRAARLRAQRHAARGARSRATCCIVADDELDGVDAPRRSRRRARSIVHRHDAAGVGAARAAVVLPIANFAEEEGTFTNLRGRVQRFLQAQGGAGRRAAELVRAGRSARARSASDGRLLLAERRVRRAGRGAPGVRRA